MLKMGWYELFCTYLVKKHKMKEKVKERRYYERTFVTFRRTRQLLQH